MWQPLLDRLAGPFRLVAPDYPGFGHSDAPGHTEFAYTFDHLAAVIYRRDVSGAEVHILDAGHFALDEQPDVIADLTREFLSGEPYSDSHVGRSPSAS
jgi:pimeloyl-ACP methyl ester carboxylesterase